MVYHYQNSGKAFRVGKLLDKVHRDWFPGMERNRELTEKAIWFMLFCFWPSTDNARFATNSQILGQVYSCWMTERVLLTPKCPETGWSWKLWRTQSWRFLESRTRIYWSIQMNPTSSTDQCKYLELLESAWKDCTAGSVSQAAKMSFWSSSISMATTPWRTTGIIAVAQREADNWVEEKTGLWINCTIRLFLSFWVEVRPTSKCIGFSSEVVGTESDNHIKSRQECWPPSLSPG
jgi:hypothetical protein